MKGDHEQRPAGPELQWLLRRASSLKDDCKSNESGGTQVKQLSKKASAPWRTTTLMLEVGEDWDKWESRRERLDY